MPSILFGRLRNRLIRARLRGKALDPLARTNLTALDHLNPSQSAKSLRYVIFDLETTGLSLTRDRVVSVAAFRIVEGRILLRDPFSSLVNPGRAIPGSAVKIHGIVPSMVERAPMFADVFDQFLRYLGTDILVGYQVRFDLHFLNSFMQKRHGFPLQNLVLDAQFMCRKAIFPPHLRAHGIKFRSQQSLDVVAEHFGIETHGRHTAVGDALTTALIFQRILAEIEQTGGGKLKKLLSIGKGR